MTVNFFWFRRDLRLDDNAGLYHALKAGLPVIPVFIFDSNILSRLTDHADARISFIHDRVAELHAQLIALNSALLVMHGDPATIWHELQMQYTINAVYSNHDFEPSAIKRDKEIKTQVAQRGIDFHQFKDHVIFEKNEIVKNDGAPYTVFTPYKKKWLNALYEKPALVGCASASYYLLSYPCQRYHSHFQKFKKNSTLPSIKTLGFIRSKITAPSTVVKQNIIKHYNENRDYPGLDATSKLGPHFRFGSISIREKARKAFTLNQTYLNELIWRDFYAMILYQFPTVVSNAFRPQYDNIQWQNDQREFESWCNGNTGYPLVDAGMRQLNQIGYMHNRVRMVTASFLTKHLLIDWRWGEKYFAEKLLDYDLASNNGGWQWAAGCGTDAAPYFRIFNPITQQEKFDKDFIYCKRWIPELNTDKYPSMIVDHKFARERCLNSYKQALEK